MLNVQGIIRLFNGGLMFNKKKIMWACCAFCMAAQAQNASVSGRVQSSETKEPLQSVNIVIPNLELGSTTDINGQFTINDIPLDNIFSAPPIIKDIKEKFNGANDLVVASPDVGGVVRARAFAKRLNAGLAIADKRREKAGESEVMNIIGDVKNKTCILLDDIADSAGTLCNAAEALKKSGAKEIYSYIVHGVLSGKALDKISNSAIKELVLTDTIEPSSEVKNTKNIRHISIAPLMGEAIKRISSDASVSALFD